MKKLLIIFGMLCMLVGCKEKIEEVIVPKGDDNKVVEEVVIKPLKVKSLEYKDKTELNSYDIKIPEIEERGEYVEFLNSELQTNVNLLLKEMYTGDETKGDIRDLKIWYNIYQNNFGILSIVIEKYKYTGGAHGMTEIQIINLDEKTGEFISFETELYEYLNMKISDMIANKDNYPQIKDKDFFSGVNIDVTDKMIYFKGDKMVVVFEQYEIAPYSSGIITFEFDKKEVEKYIEK